ncbi:NADPH oxidase 4-like, partial [Ursus americanus]|uniref:NADPH oxidase 4-like n=1 Tax=Ursus americanus TaxID=9643 RepID=UPI001E67AE04
ELPIVEVLIHSQCPTETKATFGVHLKIVGDWTERFRDLLLPPSNQDSEILPFIQSRKYPKVQIRNSHDLLLGFNHLLEQLMELKNILWS